MPQKRARRVDGNRQTPPTPSGKSYPILFGPFATTVLMYLAVHPGCTMREMKRFLNCETYSNRINYTLWRLKKRGIVVGSWCHSINPNLKYHIWLRLVLRKLAVHHGLMAPARKTQGTYEEMWARHEAPEIDFPVELIQGSVRRRILMAIACLKECYLSELIEIFNVQSGSLGRALYDLEAEGLVQMREVDETVNAWSLNPGFCAAFEFGRLLRCIAMDQRQMYLAIQKILFDREMKRAQTYRHRRHVVTTLAIPAHVIAGVRKFRAIEARRKFLNLKTRPRKPWGQK